jgi:peptidyl-prolyl cis-trans isomerase D
MISWIQRTFQQHFKWLFLALLIVVIISFVFITNASSGLGHTAKTAPARPFFGLNLGNAEDTQALVKDATLSVQLHGMQMRSEGQFQQYALQRRAALHLAGELNLPAPTNDQLAAHIRSLPAFADPAGTFDAKRYADFRDSLKTNPRLREADVTRVLADDVTYQQVLKLLSGPGYVLPADVQNQLNRIDATWTLEAVTVDYASFKPVIAVTDEALSQFFEYNAARYRVAPKTGVSYIDFPLSAYTSGVTFTEEGLRAYFDANSSRFLPPAGEKAPASPDAAFAAARAQVEQAYRAERAQTLADQAAADLAVALFEVKATAETLPALVASRNLTLKRVAPFNADNVPAELGGSPRVAIEAAKTGPARLVSDPVNTGRGAALLIWNETVPARQPALAEVKERVTADYLESEKRKRFADAGRTLRTALEARLKAGDTLAKAVAATGKTIPAKLETKSWPAFTLATPPADFDYTLYSALESLQKGQLSPMLTTQDRGIIVYAADKQNPVAAAGTPKFIDTQTRLAAYTASRNGGALLAALVEAELAKSEPVTP